MDDNVKCALIGLGRMGHSFTEAIRQTSGISLVGGCDIFKRARKRYATKHPDVPLFSSASELLEKADFEAAFVLTPDSGHAEPFIRCLEAGKHVFVEKPVGNTVEEVMEMLRAMDRNPKLVAVAGHVLRYEPNYRKMKAMAEAGEFGDIFYMEGDYIHHLLEQAEPDRFNSAIGKNWYLEDEKPMVGGGCHPFDLLQWVVGVPAVSVSSAGNRIAFPQMKHEDCVVSIFKFANGAVAKVTALYGPVCPRMPFNNVAVYGTKATVWRDQVCFDHAKGWQRLEFKEYQAKVGHGFEREVVTFARAIRFGEKVLTPARDCARSALATIVATEALQTGKELLIPQI